MAQDRSVQRELTVPHDVNRTLDRMTSLADRYGTAEELLAQSTRDTGNTSSILGFLRMEILLKAVFLCEKQSMTKHGHQYEKIWTVLPDEVKNAIMCSAKERVAGHADFSDVEAILKNWGKMFVAARYEYEATMDETEAESEARGRDWLIAGAKPEDADFAFYPMELLGFTYGLKEFLLSASFPSTQQDE